MSKKMWVALIASVLGVVALIIVLPLFVWQVIGWIFLGLFALLLLLLLVPAVVYVQIKDGDFTLKARVLLVKLTIFPRKPRPAKPQAAPPPAENPEPEEEKPKKKRTTTEIIELTKRIASSASVAMKFVFKFLRIKDVELVLPVSAGDAAAVAIRFGQVQTLVGTTRAVLNNLVHIRFTRIVVLPDFTGDLAQSLFFSCKIAASPVIMVVAGVMGFTRFLTYNRKQRRKSGKQKLNQGRRDSPSKTVKQAPNK